MTPWRFEGGSFETGKFSDRSGVRGTISPARLRVPWAEVRRPERVPEMPQRHQP
jgi:hypothetical protein